MPGRDKHPVVYDPRTGKIFYDKPINGIDEITNLGGGGGGGGAVDSVAGKTGAVTLDKADVGLDQVDNTSDADKPVSTATQTALDAKADTTALAAKADTTALAAKADTTTVNTALSTKADLVSGTVPTNQLPAAALAGGGVATLDSGHGLTLTPSDNGKVLGITGNSPNSTGHGLVVLDWDQNWDTDTEIDIICRGGDRLEIWPFEWDSAIQTPTSFGHFGMGLGVPHNGRVTLRRLDTYNWIANGDIVDPQHQIYDVTAVTGAYVFNGNGLSNSQNPSLTCKIGQQIVFDMAATGHPLWIKTTQGTGAGVSTVTQTNYYVYFNGTEDTGNVLFRPRVAGTYYYQCQYHNAMHGTITVT